MFPNSLTLSEPRRPRNIGKEFARRARKMGFKKLLVHDLRGGHETMLLDAGAQVHVVAARCGHDPRHCCADCAKRTRKADTSAPATRADKAPQLTEKEKKNPENCREPGQRPKYQTRAFVGHKRL